MHLVEGMTTWPWALGGFAVAAGLTWDGLRRLEIRDIPRTAVLTSGFFVASLIHLPPVFGASVHLLLNGLLGILLGLVATPAILVGLGLQAMVGHGSLTTLGLNTCIMAIPALAAAGLFRLSRRLPLSVRGFLCGAVGVLGAGSLFAGVLLLSLPGQAPVAWATLSVHLPFSVLEGLIVMSTVLYLKRLRPELLPEAGARRPSSPAPVLLTFLCILLHPAVARAHEATEGAHHHEGHHDPPWGIVLGAIALLLSMAALFMASKLLGRVEELETRLDEASSPEPPDAS